MLNPVPTRRAQVKPSEFLQRLPEHQRQFYAALLRELPTKFVVTTRGIAPKHGYYSAEPFCSAFRVKERVETPATKTWSRIVELIDPRGEIVECIVPDGKLLGKPREAIAMLSDRGLWVVNDDFIRETLDLVRNWPVPAQAQRLLIDGVGWTPDHDAFILTSGRVISRTTNSTKYRFSGAPKGKDIGTLEKWRNGVSTLAIGNANMTFAIALGFSSALMAFTDLNTSIFHFFGKTSRGKTRILRTALSVWPRIGEKDKTWDGTINGLEGEIADSNGTLMGLDELREEAVPDLPGVIYRLGNGAGKGRADKEGRASDRATWSTAVVSTGEFSFADIVKKLGKIATGGQGVRMLDIPAEGVFGVFDELHDAETADAFLLKLDTAIRKASGPAGAAFIERLLAYATEDLKDRLSADVQSSVRLLQEHLGIRSGDEKTAEIRRVLGSFAVVSVAGEWATVWGLTGWEPGLATEAVKAIASRWLDARGRMPLDQSKSVEHMRDYLAAHETQFVQVSEVRSNVSIPCDPPGFQDELYFYILPSTIAKIGEDKAKCTAMMTAILDAGYLEKGSEKNSLQFKMNPIAGHRPRVYRIHRAILEFDGNAVSSAISGTQHGDEQ